MPFLTADWTNLIMLNYEIDPGLIADELPFGVEPDEEEGRTYLSLVGFLFGNTAVRGIKWPGYVDFEEINLRAYVQRTEGDTLKRGVFFIKEIVPKSLIALIARKVYKEPYERWQTSHIYEMEEDGRMGVSYAWTRQGIDNRIAGLAGVEVHDLLPGSHEAFIAEHYWGYTRISPHMTYEYQVTHPAWQYRDLSDLTIACRFDRVFGDKFSFLKDREPYSAFMAIGSAVSVGAKRIIRNPR